MENQIEKEELKRADRLTLVTRAYGRKEGQVSTALRDAALSTSIASIPRKEIEAQKIRSGSSRSRLDWRTRILVECRAGEGSVVPISLGQF